MGNEMPSRTEEERKEALAQAFSRVKANVVQADNENKGSVLERITAIASKKEENPKEDKTTDKNKPLGIDEIVKASKENSKRMEEAGIGLQPREKDDRDAKDKENEKSKEKDRKEPTKSAEDKKKEAAQTCKLPSGYEIKEVAGKYMLVNPKFPDKQTDVTEVFDKIEKYNEEVEAVNKANATQPTNTNPTRDVITHDQKVDEVSGALPEVKDTEGKQVFQQGDLQAVAEFAVSKAESEMKREMEEQLKESDDKNRKGDDKQQNRPNIRSQIQPSQNTR